MRCFVVAIVGCMVLDTIPWAVLPSDRPKEWLKQITNRAGIWQGEWSLFTPSPSVDFHWLTADISRPDGSSEDWSSPYWQQCDAGQKFYRFREMNYFNRLSLNQYRIAAQDLADYLRRSQPDEDASVVLFLNGLKMVDPPDGELPPPSEIVWLTYSDVIARSESGSEERQTP